MAESAENERFSLVWLLWYRKDVHNIWNHEKGVLKLMVNSAVSIYVIEVLLSRLHTSAQWSEFFDKCTPQQVSLDHSIW